MPLYVMLRVTDNVDQEMYKQIEESMTKRGLRRDFLMTTSTEKASAVLQRFIREKGEAERLAEEKRKIEAKAANEKHWEKTRQNSQVAQMATGRSSRSRAPAKNQNPVTKSIADKPEEAPMIVNRTKSPRPVPAPPLPRQIPTEEHRHSKKPEAENNSSGGHLPVQPVHPLHQAPTIQQQGHLHPQKNGSSMGGSSHIAQKGTATSSRPAPAQVQHLNPEEPIPNKRRSPLPVPRIPPPLQKSTAGDHPTLSQTIVNNATPAAVLPIQGPSSNVPKTFANPNTADTPAAPGLKSVKLEIPDDEKPQHVAMPLRNDAAVATTSANRSNVSNSALQNGRPNQFQEQQRSAPTTHTTSASATSSSRIMVLAPPRDLKPEHLLGVTLNSKDVAPNWSHANSISATGRPNPINGGPQSQPQARQAAVHAAPHASLRTMVLTVPTDEEKAVHLLNASGGVQSGIDVVTANNDGRDTQKKNAPAPSSSTSSMKAAEIPSKYNNLPVRVPPLPPMKSPANAGNRPSTHSQSHARSSAPTGRSVPINGGSRSLPQAEPQPAPAMPLPSVRTMVLTVPGDEKNPALLINSSGSVGAPNGMAVVEDNKNTESENTLRSASAPTSSASSMKRTSTSSSSLLAEPPKKRRKEAEAEQEVRKGSGVELRRSERLKKAAEQKKDETKKMFQ